MQTDRLIWNKLIEAGMTPQGAAGLLGYIRRIRNYSEQSGNFMPEEASGSRTELYR